MLFCLFVFSKDGTPGDDTQSHAHWKWCQVGWGGGRAASTGDVTLPTPCLGKSYKCFHLYGLLHPHHGGLHTSLEPFQPVGWKV